VWLVTRHLEATEYTKWVSRSTDFRAATSPDRLCWLYPPALTSRQLVVPLIKYIETEETLKRFKQASSFFLQALGDEDMALFQYLG
jgi:hypothetical protein